MGIMLAKVTAFFAKETVKKGLKIGGKALLSLGLCVAGEFVKEAVAKDAAPVLVDAALKRTMKS